MAGQTAPSVEGKTIDDVLRATVDRVPDQVALVFPQRAWRATWREFDRLVEQVARGLLSLGLEPGDRVAVWCTNHPEWVLLQFATARIGAVLATVNPAFRDRELEYAVAHSEAKVLALTDRFKTSDYFEILGRVCHELNSSGPGSLESTKFPNLRWVLSMASTHQPGMLGWSELVDRGASVSDAAMEERRRGLDPEDEINLQYTSGTTGFPKGARLSHRSLLLNGFHAGNGMRLTSDDSICIPVPLYHCFGCVLGTLVAVVHGATMVFPHESFDPGKTLDAIERERCTALYGVPTMFIAELEHPSFPGRDLRSLRTGIMAGSPCPLELMRRVRDDMGADEMTIGYGQTEASPLLTQTRYDDPVEIRVGTVGRALPGVEVKIVDPATGAELPDGQSGELCGRGHPLMLGYLNNPEATAKAIDSEGWLHTGDLALRDANGCYRITGRLKDMIIRGGENIYPREIEECLYTHPAIEEVQVVGVPDVKYGEEILAWIKPRRDACIDADVVRTFCRERMAHFKTPRYIKFVTEFPTTVTGKIQKYRIREIAVRELGLQQAASMETA